MKVNEDLAIVKVPVDFGSGPMELNLSLIIDGDQLALVDAGMPGQGDAILAEIKKLGYDPANLKRIFLTHGDIDHIGSLAELKEKTGAEVYASSTERPYIEGDLPSVKRPSPERLAQMPVFAAALESLKLSKVDHVVEYGDTIDFAGGVRVVPTPGHTPGHASFYLLRSKALISGDALTAKDGQLQGPMPQGTPDMASAKKAVRELQNLDIQTIVTYHGGLVSVDVPAQIRRVAAEE